jgi:hypothetical protein
MSAIRNIPIARKFTIAFGIVCVLSLGFGAYTCNTFRSIHNLNEDVSANGFPAFIALAEMRGALSKLRNPNRPPVRSFVLPGFRSSQLCLSSRSVFW